MRPSVVLVLILASSLPSCAQQAQGKAAGPLLSLVLKQPIAAGSAVNVVWSPDEQYVLLKTNSSVGTKDSSRSTVTLSVFSVESGIEVLHLTLARAVLGSFAFAHHSKNLFVASQSGLFACALDHLVQCMTLETDLFMTPAGAFFALTPQDQLFYVSTQSERVLVTLGKSAVASKAILGAGERPDLDALQNPGIADAPEFFGVPPWGGAYIANIWQSPSGKMSMITRNDQDGTLSLWLSRPGAAGQAHAAFLLGGTRAPLRRVEINTLRQSVITRDTGFKEWSFSTGKVVTFPYNVEFAASGEVGYFTPATASGDVQQLMLQAAGSAAGKASGVQLPAVPEWFGLSATGDAIVIQGVLKDLSIFKNGKVTSLRCDNTLEPSNVPPTIGQSGLVLSAFCGDKTHREFVTWDLTSLAETSRTPAVDLDSWGSVSASGNLASIGGLQSVRIITLAGSSAPLDLKTDLIGNEYTVAGQILNGDKFLGFGVNQPDAGTATAEIFDLSAVKSIGRLPSWPGRIQLASFQPDGSFISVDEQGIASFYNTQANRFVRLVSLSPVDWLVFAEDGRFDGTPDALGWAALRYNNQSAAIPVTSLFNELYTPGLLGLVIREPIPAPKPVISAQTYLELPQTTMLLQEGMTAALIDGKATACFKDEVLFRAVEKARGDTPPQVAQQDLTCPFRFVLSDQSAAPEVVAALNSLNRSYLKTEWDQKQFAASPKTLHIFSVGISEYLHPGLPKIPLASSGALALQKAIEHAANGTNVVIWNDGRCGTDLQNQHATKQNIAACFNKMADSVGPDDEVIIIFAGHGGTVEEGGIQGELFYYYPADYDMTVSSVKDAISSAELSRAMQRLSAQRIVFILNACDSGSAAVPMERLLAALMRERVYTATFENTPPPALQGALVITAQSGLENVSANSTSDPFMDKLISIISTTAPGGLSTASIELQMQQPLPFTGANGAASVSHPTAATIGASFSIAGK